MKWFWPQKIDIKQVWLDSLVWFVSSLIWAVILIVMTFWIGNFIDLDKYFWNIQIYDWANILIPFFVSIMAFLAILITNVVIYFSLSWTNPDKFRRKTTHLKQIVLVNLLIYILFSPIYMFAWSESYQNVLYVFLGNIIFSNFATNLTIESINNYRYILLWVYANLASVLITIMIVLMIFLSISTGKAKLISMIFLFPLVNTISIFLKESFELLYYKYYKATWYDQLWDITYQIEMEEEEELKEAQESNI